MKTFYSQEYSPVPNVSALHRGSCHILLPLKIFQRLALNLGDVVTISISKGLDEGKTFIGRAWLCHINAVEWDPTVCVKRETTRSTNNNNNNNNNWELTKYSSSELDIVSLAFIYITTSNLIAKSFMDYLIGQRIPVVFNSVNYVQFHSENIQIYVASSSKQIGEFSEATKFIWLDHMNTLMKRNLFSSDNEELQPPGWLSYHEKTFLKICEFFETSIEHNCPHVQGMLLCGPSGIGKTCTVRMAARHCCVPLFEFRNLNNFEYFGQAEQTLRTLFCNARKCSSALIFIDDLDSLCPKRFEHSQNLSSRIVSQLAYLLDTLRKGIDISNRKETFILSLEDITNSRILCVAATRHPHAIDSSLRIPGRLDKEVILLPPSEEDRKEVLSNFLQFYHCEINTQLISTMVHLSNGFIGVDFSQTFLESLRVWANSLKDSLSQILLEKIREHTPSLLRGPYTLEISPIGWNDIGGYEDVKQRLKMAVEWPRKYSSLWKHFNLTTPRGILLQGPPGCSKTTLVKATAKESGLPILCLSGADLYSCYLGESESILRMAFEIARSASPSILFIDELDSILGKRELESEGNLVKERLLSTFLTEMDGIISAEQVLVIGASNRSDLLDDALLRPGRFDEIIQVDLPDALSRKRIFQIYLRETNCDSFIWDEILESTEGWSGAEIANVCRQAVFLVLRHERTTVSMEDIRLLLDELKDEHKENGN